MISKTLKYSLIAGACLSLGAVGVAQATVTGINFDQNNSNAASGNISYDGNGGALIGSSIGFDTITGKNSPQNSGTANSINCQDCSLNFSTGANQSEGPDLWTFASGGTFDLTGTAVAADGSTIASGNLSSGSFSDTPSVNSNGGLLLIATGFGNDTKNAALASYFGFDGTNFQFAVTNISGDFTVGDDGSLSGTVTNGDIVNAKAVPEPSALFMLGAGLLGLGLLGRKRSSKL